MSVGGWNRVALPILVRGARHIRSLCEIEARGVSWVRLIFGVIRHSPARVSLERGVAALR